jgi:predicted metal-dependent phosphoesterase TrpH
MRGDLHLHTTKSDGVWTPERLFDEIRARDLRVFCVSDHDCIEAYPMPDDLRDRCIPGLEVDSHHGGHTAHILGYGVEDKQSPLLRTLTAQREARRERMAGMIERLNGLGIGVTIEDVQAQAGTAVSLGRPHLARALVARGVVATVQEAFDRYIADEGDGFVALERLTSERIIELIHESGGVAIVAHPVRLRDPKHLAELCDFGADGVEVIHPTADEATQQELRDFAAQRNLLVTGGTDFHAPVPDREIGVELEAADVEKLREAIARIRVDTAI